MTRKKILIIATLSSLVLTTAILVFTHVPLAYAEYEASLSEVEQPGDEPDHWLFLKLSPTDGPLEEQISRIMDALFPLLVEQQRQGRLDGFSPAPTLGAIHLESPDAEVLTHALSWSGVRAIKPVGDSGASAAAEQIESMRLAAESVHSGEATVEATASEHPVGAASVEGLSSCTIYENETLVSGWVVTPSLNMTFTLKAGGVVKSQVATVTDSDGDFRVYFTDVIRGGDVVEVALPGEAPVSIDVVPLTVEPDKAADVIYGTAPPSAAIDVEVQSFSRGWHSSYVMADSGGSFSADFSAEVDILLGDEVDLEYDTPGGFRIVLRDQRVPGLDISLAYDNVRGYAAPGVTVDLVLKDSSGAIKARTTEQTRGSSGYSSGSGYFWTDFEPNDPCAEEISIEVGDRVEMRYGSQPTVTVQVAEVTIGSIVPSDDTVIGTAPAGGKVGVYAYDGYLADSDQVFVNADAAGQYTTSFSGTLDLAPGSYAYPTYYDAQDNEISGQNLYASPYVQVNVNSWTDVEVAARPGEAVTATLRNALGAIKATGTGTATDNGWLSMRFYDSADNEVDAGPGDRVEVNFGSGSSRTVDVTGVDFVVDRDMDTVSGTGPANTDLRIIEDWGDGVNVTTDASGYFSYEFGRLSGGDAIEVFYRNPEGNDLSFFGYVPQFTVYPDTDYLYGYGPPNETVVVNVQDDTGATKGTANRTTQDGYYYLGFSDVDIAFGDTVVVDVGSLHYEQEIVTLTIAADTTSDVVYGTAPSDAWLNVFADRSFGPYDAYYYRYFRADYAGSYATNFWEGADVRGGDYLRVLYWENGHEDRVSVRGYAPNVGIYHVLDRIAGYTTPGAVGTVTVRDSGGTLKASGTVTGSADNGGFSFVPEGVDIVPGDEVAVDVGTLNQTVDVMPMSGSLDLDADTATGTSVPDGEIGVAVYHWSGSYYSYWTEAGYLRRFVGTDGAGAFSLDLHCLADLAAGDYLGLYYIDELDTYYGAYFYTTQPTVTVDSHPTTVQPGAPVEVEFTIAEGAHVSSAYVRWDVVSHRDENAYSNYSYVGGTVGSNVARFNAPRGGTVYFKVLAYVDGQTVWSAREYTVSVERDVATTLVDPVSGTTNDSTPQIQGVAPPNADVTLYEGTTELMTTGADAEGRFTFDLVNPLSSGSHDLHAAATVDGTVGPDSNVVRLNVNPTLKVDPVHILITSRGATQHLRDDNGYANLGGRIWTRTGDPVDLTVPISCTDVYTADLYVGGLLATPLHDSGGDVYVGTYTPPGSGTYRVDVAFRCGGSAGTEYAVNLLTGLIDPDGYVYDEEQGEEYRLAGATVTCYELVDEGSGTWQAWDAALWGQINPQTTAADGYYSFFTLPGKYKVKVTRPGYADYESPVLTVADEPVHHNVALRLMRYVYLPLVMRHP